MRALLAVALLTGAALVTGHAASVALSTQTVGMARVGVPRCVTGASTVLSNLSGSSIVSVTISGLPSACGGATAQAAVNNGTTSSSGTATVPAGGGSVTVTLATAVAASTTYQTDVVLTGP
jgi:hypothetical protein